MNPQQRTIDRNLRIAAEKTRREEYKEALKETEIAAAGLRKLVDATCNDGGTWKTYTDAEPWPKNEHYVETEEWNFDVTHEK